jgi:HUS1 checkpoint protein
MRFKAKLAPEQVSLLYSVIVPLARLSSSASETSAWARNGSILYMDSDRFSISCKGRSQETDGISCFAEFRAAEGIFLEHRIESVAENNGILMEIDLGQLKLALQSVCANNSSERGTIEAAYNLDERSAVFKLAKRNNMACLCIEALSASKIQVHHAVPVRILRVTDKQQYMPPMIDDPTVKLQIVAPHQVQTRPLRTILENMRSMETARSTHPTVLVYGNQQSGELTISLESEGASIRAYFADVAPAATADPEKYECTVKVDARKLSAALQWQQQPQYISSALLGLLENQQLILHVTLEPAGVGFFTYYVPVHYLSKEAD